MEPMTITIPAELFWYGSGILTVLVLWFVRGWMIYRQKQDRGPTGARTSIKRGR